jgi:hypothetical protein
LIRAINWWFEELGGAMPSSPHSLRRFVLSARRPKWRSILCPLPCSPFGSPCRPAALREELAVGLAQLRGLLVIEEGEERVTAPARDR